MPRLTAAKRWELEAFWRRHLEGWRRSVLNQREYCELHGLPLKRFGNLRATLKHEEPASAGKLLYRRGGALSHMTNPMTKEAVPAPSGPIPSARSSLGKRRNFSTADKRRLVEEASRPGASVSGVARQYGIATRQLFRWKQERAPVTETKTTFLAVTLTDMEAPSPAAVQPVPEHAPVILERSAPGIEVELIGGRRVHFGADADPEAVHRLVSQLEGEPR